MQVRVRARLQAEVFLAQLARVDCEGAVGRGAVGEGVGEEGVVGERCGGGGGRCGRGGGGTGGMFAGGAGGWVELWDCCLGGQRVGTVGVGGGDRGGGYVAVEAEEESSAIEEGRRGFGHVLLLLFCVCYKLLLQR